VEGGPWEGELWEGQWEGEEPGVEGEGPLDEGAGPWAVLYNRAKRAPQELWVRTEPGQRSTGHTRDVQTEVRGHTLDEQNRICYRLQIEAS